VEYCNLDLDAFDYRVAGDDERFRVRVTSSPAGEQRYTDAEEVTISPDLRRRLRSLEKRSLDLPGMIALGEDLAALLFPPRARSFLTRSLERLDEDEGLRIRLKANAYALADLPWEYVYVAKPDTPRDQKGAEGFLALDRQISFVRYEIMGQSLVDLDPVGTDPLRLVMVTADPGGANYPELNLDTERENIERALAGTPDIQAECYADATVETLEEALTRQAHIFHFAGHGQFEGDIGQAFGSMEGEGSLVLIDDRGQPMPFSSEKLAQNLRGRGVRLAVLGACETGRRDQVNAWTGIAPSLSRAGVPAVLAMQYTIRDDNAIAFSRRFYAALAAGEPVDAAVIDGRLAIFNRSSEDDRDWGVPVLYLRAEEGVLFPRPQAAGVLSAAGKAWLGRPGSVAILASAATLLLSVLSGLNQFVGFFSKITLPTAILSALLALVVAVAFPALLRRKQPQGKTVLKMSFRNFSILLAVLILLAGVGPFLGKYWVAAQAKSAGTELVDLHRYGAALPELDRATRYLQDLGLSKLAVESELGLIQACAGLGDRARAEQLIAEVEESGSLDAHSQGELYTIRGNIAYARGEFVQAQRFYEIARQTIEPASKSEAILLQNQAVLLAGRGVSYRDRALEYYRRAQEIYQALDDDVGPIYILINEGTLYENDPDKARAFYEEAQIGAEKLQDPYLLGTIVLNIGLTYRQQGDLDRAQELYDQARLHFEEAADTVGQAEVLVSMASVESARGRRELARQHLQASESYLRNIDLDQGQAPARKVAQIRTFQADIYDALGESELAERLYEEALSIFSQHPDPLLEAKTQVNYAGLLLRLARREEALNQIRRAREILEAYSGQDPHESLGVLYNNLGRAYQDMGDLPTALEYYDKAVQIFEAIGVDLLYAQARENRGLVCIWLGDREGEQDLLEALEIYRAAQNRDHEAQTLFNLYSIYTANYDPSASSMIEEIIALLAAHNIDHEIEAGILFGIMVQDIGDQADLIVYRERLRQLKVFYEDREESIGLGRSLLKLAEVEQAMGNWSKVEEFAREAEAYAGNIPLPWSIQFHSDLGFYLIGANPEDGLDHFLEAFDLAGTVSVDQQSSLAVVIHLYLSTHAGTVDREKYRGKAQNVVETTEDPEIRRTFQEIVDLLTPARD